VWHGQGERICAYKKKARLKRALFRGPGKKSLLHHYATLFWYLFERIQISQERRYIIVFKFNDNRFPTFFGRHPFDEILFGFFERHGDFWHKTPPEKVDVDYICKSVFPAGNKPFLIGTPKKRAHRMPRADALRGREIGETPRFL
jgi:hypothetical protein